MLNNPDIQPNASMNCWLTGIQTFNFKLRHISATKYQGPDGLCRRRRGEDKEEQDESEEEVEEGIDEVLGCGVWIARGLHGEGKVSVFLVGEGEDKDGMANFNAKPPTDNDSRKWDEDLQHISTYLRSLDLPASISEKECTRLIQHSKQFFVRSNQLWR